jgi:RHS repeat-associated protein
MDQAGGVGGLLLASFNAASTTNAFATFDGNGNVTGLINAGDKSNAARYEYSPFGEPLRTTGSLARQNAIRFSTKFSDDESGLIYYGYRYYSPSLGRWVGRDPAEEGGGLNLYAALLNSPLTQIDPDGRIQFGGSAILRLILSIGMIWRQTQTGQPIMAVWSQYLQEIRMAAAGGMRAATMAPAGGAGTAAGGVGGPPKNFYRYPGAGWALALVGSSLMATYSTVYAGANLALGQRSAQGTYMYDVESGLIDTINGDAAYADLDFIGAALTANGGVGSTALVAWDTFSEGADIFATGYDGQ